MNATPPSKRCSGCGQVKLAEDFHRDRQKADGLAKKCKKCMNARIQRLKAIRKEFA